MARQNKGKSNAEVDGKDSQGGETRQVEDNNPIMQYYLDLLRETSAELPEPLEDLDEVLASIKDSLQSVLVAHQLAEGEDDPFDLTDEELDEELESETNKLQREERRIQRHQALLEEEQSRLKSFKRAREAQEKVEQSEEAERLHAYARAIIADDAPQQRRVPPRILSQLKVTRRGLVASNAGAEPYQPAMDPFLRGLLEKLKPVLTSLDK